MILDKKINLGFMTIGNLKDNEQRLDYEKVYEKIEKFGPRIIDYGTIKPKLNESNRISSIINRIPKKELDVLLLIVLEGGSAQTLERVIKNVNCPCIIWAVKGRWAWASSSLAIGALREKKKTVKLIYGSGDDKEALDEFRKILCTAYTFSQLHRYRIGKIGSLFPNLISCDYDASIIKTNLGIEIVEISFDELRHTIDIVSKNIDAIKELKAKIFNRFIVKTTDEVLIPGLKLHLALKSIAKKQNLNGFAIECWSKMPKKIGLNPCLGFIEDDYTLACEGDVLTCIAVQTIRYLTGIYPYAGDIYELDKENILTLVHCGAPASLAKGEKTVIIQESPQARKEGFPTAVCRPTRMKKGKVLIFRLYGRGCNHLHLAGGELLEVKNKDKLMLKIKLSGNRRNFLEHCLGNHYIVISSDIQEEIELLCKWLEINIIKT